MTEILNLQNKVFYPFLGFENHFNSIKQKNVPDIKENQETNVRVLKISKKSSNQLMQTH